MDLAAVRFQKIFHRTHDVDGQIGTILDEARLPQRFAAAARNGELDPSHKLGNRNARPNQPYLFHCVYKMGHFEEILPPRPLHATAAWVLRRCRGNVPRMQPLANGTFTIR